MMQLFDTTGMSQTGIGSQLMRMLQKYAGNGGTVGGMGSAPGAGTMAPGVDPTKWFHSPPNFGYNPTDMWQGGSPINPNTGKRWDAGWVPPDPSTDPSSPSYGAGFEMGQVIDGNTGRNIGYMGSRLRQLAGLPTSQPQGGGMGRWGQWGSSRGWGRGGRFGGGRMAGMGGYGQPRGALAGFMGGTSPAPMAQPTGNRWVDKTRNWGGQPTTSTTPSTPAPTTLTPQTFVQGPDGTWKNPSAFSNPGGTLQPLFRGDAMKPILMEGGWNGGAKTMPWMGGIGTPYNSTNNWQTILNRYTK